MNRVAILLACSLAMVVPQTMHASTTDASGQALRTLATPQRTAQLTDAAAMFRGNAARTGEQPGPGPSGAPTVRWEFKAGGKIWSSPTIAAGVVYFGSHDGSLYAVDAESGRLRWSLRVGDTYVIASPAVVAGVVYVGAGGTLYALDATTGAERWHVETGSTLISSPAVVANVVYVVNLLGIPSPTGVLAFDAQTGTLLWQYEPDGAVNPAEVAVGAGSVFLTAYESNQLWSLGVGHVFALDPVTGRERWRVETSAGVRSCPVVVGNDVFVYDGMSLHRVGVLTGDDESVVTADAPWTEIDSSPAVVAGVAYFVSGDGYLYAADTTTGGLWTWRIPIGPIPSSPSVVGNSVYVAGYGVVEAIDTATGNQRWSLDLPTVVRTTPAVAGGSVYVGGDDGILYAIS
jgi:outer membrane protein assembly factor BamB